MRGLTCAAALAVLPQLAAASYAASTPARVSADRQKEYLSIDAVTIAPLGPARKLDQIPAPPPPPPPTGGTVSLDHIIDTALRIWAIIKENAPVVNVNKQYANAVPEGLSHWTQLSRWNRPFGREFSIKAVNKLGMTVVECRYLVIYSYGGRFKEASGQERGRYLTGVTVEPLKIDVKWGYRFDFTANVPNVVNVGTSEEPVAGMTVNLDWLIRTQVQHSQGTAIYFVDGNGNFASVGGPSGKKNELGNARELLRRNGNFLASPTVWSGT